MKFILGALSVIIATITVMVGLTLILSSDGGGFFPGLGAALGWLALGAGNTLAFLLNALYWRIYGGPSWFRLLVIVQAIPALWFGAMAASEFYDHMQESKASDQRSAIYEAIQSDDVTTLRQAQLGCNKQCSDNYDLNSQLLDAADVGAQRVAKLLIQQSAKVASGLATEETMRTCEGDYLSGQNTLSVAVARNDPAMVKLLLPVSDKGSRQRAMWLAARLDRLALVQALAQDGVPLTIRGDILDSNNTLLVAAAEGAALNVGRWLIDTQHMPIEAIKHGPDFYPGTAPMEGLFTFMRSVPDSPRIAPFLDMLIEHGADVNKVVWTKNTMLQESIRTHSKHLVKLLLDAGAKTSLLSAEQQAALTKLLATPDEPSYPPEQVHGCVTPGG